MGMRNSDASFLRREVIPILSRTASISPDAQEVLDRLNERLNSEVLPEQYGWSLNKWYKLTSEDGSPAGWHITVVVDGYEVPYLHGVYFDEGPEVGRVSLVLDQRYVMETTIEELGDWVSFMANAMAISAGRTSHGSNSYIRNPHGGTGFSPSFYQTFTTTGSTTVDGNYTWSQLGQTNSTCSHNVGQTCDCNCHPCSHC